MSSQVNGICNSASMPSFCVVILEQFDKFFQFLPCHFYFMTVFPAVSRFAICIYFCHRIAKMPSYIPIFHLVFLPSHIISSSFYPCYVSFGVDLQFLSVSTNTCKCHVVFVLIILFLPRQIVPCVFTIYSFFHSNICQETCICNFYRVFSTVHNVIY